MTHSSFCLAGERQTKVVGSTKFIISSTEFQMKQCIQRGLTSRCVQVVKAQDKLTGVY